MPKTMSLSELDGYLTDKVKKTQAVLGELSEVQAQFVNAYEDSKSRHDAALSALSAQAAAHLEELPPELRQAVANRLEYEMETLEARLDELAEVVVPDATQIADDLLLRAQDAVSQMRTLNPKLDAEEEQLKAERAEMEAQLARYNAELKQRSGCLKALFNFSKILDLDRERQKLLGRLEANNEQLRKVREQWNLAHVEYLAEETRLQAEWQQANVRAAALREELAHLDDEDRRKRLALERAIFYELDNWKLSLADDSKPMTLQVNEMVQHNIRTDAYQEGLGRSAGFIALLRGIEQGLHNVVKSVEALHDEQKMHSSYLSPLKIEVGDSVLSFHSHWEALQAKVKDEKALGQAPGEFSALLDQETEGWLSEKSITNMFESLGAAISKAADSWRG